MDKHCLYNRINISDVSQKESSVFLTWVQDEPLPIPEDTVDGQLLNKPSLVAALFYVILGKALNSSSQTDKMTQ